ncbi:MAG: biotin/lipoyl-containing protein [Candidatus Aminicenantia bacterium]
MRKFILNVNGVQKVVEFLSVKEGSYNVRVDGKEYKLNIIPIEESVIILEMEGRIYDCFVYENRNGYVVYLKGETIEVERGALDIKKKGLEKEGRIEVKAKMPGKVKRIVATTGDFLKKDSGVLILEAMKMENEIKAPKDGVLKEINVRENMTVEVGTTLFVIE